MHYRLRSFSRVPVDAEIVLTLRGATHTGVLSDISLGGLFVSLSEQLPVAVGDVYKLSFQLPLEAGHARIVENGMLLRVTRHGLAFRFVEPHPESLRMLFRFIYQETV